MTSDSKAENRGDEPQCPSEIRGVIAQMDEVMTSVRRYNNAMLPTQTAVDLINDGKVASFSQFETWLRQMGSRVHFVAVPLDYFGKKWIGKTVYPFEAEGEPEYVLWAGVNGDAEAERVLTKIGISAEDNLQRLLNAGVLVASND